MNLLLVRHGEIPSNVNKVYAGRSTEGLTEKGLDQAKEVAEKLKSYTIHSMYSSPIQRAFQTATIISEVIGHNIIIMDEFREMEFGPWEGESEESIAKSYPAEWHIWNNSPAELRLKQRETLQELQTRVLAGIKSIYDVSDGKTVVVVSHVAIIRVLLLWHREMDLNLYKTIHIPNAEIFEIEIDSQM